MSISSVNSKRILDSRLSQSPQNKEFCVPVSGKQVTVRDIPAASQTSLNSINFNLSPNSPANVIDRNILFQFDLEITIPYTVSEPPAVNDRLIRKSKFAIRGFNHIVQSTNLTINGLTLSQETSAITHAMAHFSKHSDFVRFNTVSPSLMDCDYVQNYNQASDTVSVNSLAQYTDSTHARFGKGSYNFEIVEDGAIGGDVQNGFQAKIRVTLNEMVTLSPLKYDDSYESGLANVTSMEINFITWNYARLLAVASGVAPDKVFTISSVNVELKKARAFMTELSYPSYIAAPLQSIVAYNEIYRQVSSGGGASTQAATIIEGKVTGGEGSIVTNNYNLSVGPSKIIVFVKEKDSDITGNPNTAATTPDTYATINRIEVNFNTSNALLSSATPVVLYQKAQRNGLDMSFQQFTGVTPNTQSGAFSNGDVANYLFTTGSIVALDFSHDLGCMDETSLTSTALNANFSMKIDFQNRSTRPKVFEATVLYVNAGILSLAPSQAFKYNTILTRAETTQLKLVEAATDKPVPMMEGMVGLKAAEGSGLQGGMLKGGDIYGEPCGGAMRAKSSLKSRYG
jgi:hypothetical protein